MASHQEEHSLLISLSGKLLQTTLSKELSVLMDELFVATEVSLRFGKLHKVLLE